MKQQLKTLEQNTLESIKKVTDLGTLRDIEVDVLGRKGKLTEILKGLRDLSLEEKKEIGPISNTLKDTLQKAIDSRRIKLEEGSETEQLESEWIDVTLPKKTRKFGKKHPITALRHELEDIFMRLGFTIFDGEELDTEYFNFDSLNIPDSHPARDMQDTFFVDLKEGKTGKYVMRTHTSNLQNRVYKKYKAPFRIFIPGKVYRYEAVDASHETTFHQCEGIVVGKDVSLSHLKYVMNKALNAIFNKEVKVRFRPGYFPFVEPGIELDFSCLLCEGKGCKICKNTGWVEFMGCGMIHPEVLKAGGIDEKKYTGFAFGFGLTRLAMMKYGITDIREFLSGDQRFVEQF